jgi:hypothetical protein
MHSHDSLRIRADPQHRGVIGACGRPDLAEGVWIGLKGNRSCDSWRNRITKGIGGMLRFWHASEYIPFRMRRGNANLYERVNPESGDSGKPAVCDRPTRTLEHRWAGKSG